MGATSRTAWAVALALLASAGPAAAAQELVVSAAASLSDAFRDLAREFERLVPGTTVTLNFAASGTLLQQIDGGAPVDVFAAADRDTMDRAQRKGLILADSRADFAQNRLVLAVPSGAPSPVKSVRDLSGPVVRRIGLGNPAYVPAGRYARQSLTSAGLWETLRPKFILGNTARQVLDYLSRGEVDAGFVFATDAGVAKDKVSVVEDAVGHEPIFYPIAVVSTSARAKGARAFVAFVRSDAARGTLARYGFAPLQAPRK